MKAIAYASLKSSTTLPKSKKWGTKYQKLTQRAVDMTMHPNDLRVRRRHWCLWKELKKMYNMDCLLVENHQDLKEISSFETIGGVS